MAIAVYDFRNEEDICQMLVCPQIRARFLRVEPGGVRTGQQHSHDLGHEVFLILKGRCEFTISGETAVLEPGQLCVALADEPHTVRVIGDEPVIMYLSVTPHVQPTHTGREADGSRHPLSFSPNTAYGVETDTTTPAAELVDRFVAATDACARMLRDAADRQEEVAANLKKSLADGDHERMEQCRNQMFEGIYDGFRQLYDLGDLWNTLSPRISNFGK